MDLEVDLGEKYLKGVVILDTNVLQMLVLVSKVSVVMEKVDGLVLLIFSLVFFVFVWFLSIFVSNLKKIFFSTCFDWPENEIRYVVIVCTPWLSFVTLHETVLK